MKKKLLKGICLTSVAFVFQACYGTPQDFGMDLMVEGHVKSKSTGLPLKGIKVYVDDSMQYVYTDEVGNFSFYIEKAATLKVRFQDVDSTANKHYLDKDTLIHTSNKEGVSLQIELDENQ